MGVKARKMWLKFRKKENLLSEKGTPLEHIDPPSAMKKQEKSAMKNYFCLDQVAVWKIHGLVYQNSLIRDVQSFMNCMTSLFCGREDMVQRKAKWDSVVVPAGLAGSGGVTLAFLPLESLGFNLSTRGPGKHQT